MTVGVHDRPRDPAWGTLERDAFTRYRDLAREHINPRVSDHESRAAFDRLSFRRLGSAGLYELGAGSDGLATLLAALEGLSTGCDDAGFVVSTIAHAGVAVPVLAAMAHHEARRVHLARLVSGEALAAVANAEPGGGTHVLGIRARARLMPQRSSFLVSARKRSITNLGEAAVILLSARRDDAPHDRSIAAFAMPADAPGCYQRRGADRMGLRSSPTGDLIARNVTVPTPSLLGDGLDFFRMCFALERLTVGALYVGAMRRALRRVTAHLERRTELRSYQYVQQRVVAIRSALAFTESLLFRTRTMWLAGDPCEVELSVLKGHGAESALGATGEVVRVLGARGYEAAGGAEKDARDMLGLTFLGGTAELHKNVVFASALKGQ